MGRDFEWLKWLGLTIVLSVLVAIYFVKSDKNKVTQTDQDVQLRTDQQYQEKLDQTVVAADENQIAAEQKNPETVNQSISVQQTYEFLSRVEELRANDSKIDLEYTPDVAEQSRKYNALIEEAENIYGGLNIANELRYCSLFAETARNLWQLRYSPSRDVEFNRNSIQQTLKSYNVAKKDCVDAVKEHLSS